MSQAGAPTRRIQSRRPDPERSLEHISKINQLARTTWFALLAACAFVSLMMMSHKDVDFFIAKSTTLPLVNVPVSTLPFFVFSPFILAAAYIYMHMQLINLWDAIADADEIIGADRLFDRIVPTMIAQAAVLYRSDTRDDRSAEPTTLAVLMQITSFFFVWVVTPLVLLGVLIQASAYHHLGLNLWVGFCIFVACAVGYESCRIARQRLSGADRWTVHAPWSRAKYLGMSALFAAILAVSAVMTTGLYPLFDPISNMVRPAPGQTGEPVLDKMARWSRTFVSQTDIAEAELTPGRAQFVSYTDQADAFEQVFRERERLGTFTPLGPLQLAFVSEANERYRNYVRTFRGPDLQFFDLRHAVAIRAFLPRANLTRARLRGASFGGAEMQGADLSQALMQGAFLGSAKLQVARFVDAAMQGADLSLAELHGADFTRAAMQGADLNLARMHGAVLTGARLHGANLSWAELQGANLSEATMHGVELVGANMDGANLLTTELPGANIREARLQGADLSGADLSGANLLGVTLRAAFLSGARLPGANLLGAQMEQVDLGGATFHGADLGLAQMISAECGAARFQLARLHATSLLCAGQSLAQHQLHFATGDMYTRLPKGLVVLECLPTTREALPDALLQAVALRGEQAGSFLRLNAEEFLSSILCERGQVPQIFEGSWVETSTESWVDERTGLVMVRQPDGSWVDTPPVEGAR